MHLVHFIIRIYHNAWSPEHQISDESSTKIVEGKPMVPQNFGTNYQIAWNYIPRDLTSILITI